MTQQTHQDTVREAVGVFETIDTLQAAIDDLLSSGFDRAALSLLATDSAVEEKLGHKYERIRAFEDDPSVPRCCYISTESLGDAEGGLIAGLMYVGAVATAGAVVASGGALALVLASAAIAGGAGGLFGALLAERLGAHWARHLQEQLDQGGLLLWVRTWTPDEERRATKILQRHSGTDVHTHSLPVPA